jgi:hypothetical protein
MSKTFEQLAEEQHAKERATAQIGRHAAELLANPAWDATWKWLRASVQESWAKSNPQDLEEQTILHTQIKVLDWTKDRFEALVRAGEAADDDQKRRLLAERAEAEREQENVFTRGLRRIRG